MKSTTRVCVAMAVLCSTSAAVLELQWEAQNSTEFCKQLPDTADYSKAPTHFPPRVLSKGYTCQRYISTKQSLSPTEYVDCAFGNITVPKPVTSNCNGLSCDGSLNLSLAMHDGIRFTWAAGQDSDSSFSFHPPLGSMLGVFTLRSPTCTGPVLTQNNLGSCTAEVPADWVPTSSDSIKLSVGGGKLSVSMELLSYRGGVTVRLPSFSISCTWDPKRLPAGCGGYQLWSYSLTNALPLTTKPKQSSAGEYHAGARLQDGVSMIHPFDTEGLTVQKGLPVSADPCLENDDVITCSALDFKSNGPCTWMPPCQMSAVPTIYPANNTMGIDDANFRFDFESWGKDFVGVRTYYYTVGRTPDEAATPEKESAMECKVPCEFVWSASGNWTIKVRAHIEASFPGRFREIFYSAVKTKTFEVIPNPTPVPTPQPTSPATPYPTPGPPTPMPSLAPPTPLPTLGTTPVPPTPLPTPLPPFATHAPTMAPTPVPATPAPTPKPDACSILSQALCKPPCKWEQQLQSYCIMESPGPMVGTAEQCDSCRLQVGEKLPITYSGCDGASGKCQVASIMYIWCNKYNITACYNRDFQSWNVYHPETGGVELHLRHCDDGDTGCGLIQLKAVAHVVFTTETTTRQWSVITDKKVFITPDDQGTSAPDLNPGETSAPTPSPEKKKSSSSTSPAGIIVLVIGIILVLVAAGGAAYLIKKRSDDEDDYSTDEEFEEAELHEYADDSDGHMDTGYDEL